MHSAIRTLRLGDSLELVRNGERLELCDLRGHTVGRLAKVYSIPGGQRCVEARVAAIVTRRREATAPEYLDYVRCDQWEVVVSELVFDVE